MSEIGLRDPYLLWTAALPAAVLAVELWLGARRRTRVPLPTFDLLPSSPRASPLPAYAARALRVAGMLFLVGIAAGLNRQVEIRVTATPPSALVLVLDTSSSMTAEDFAPQDRLAAAKQALADFIAGRPEPEMGLVQFAASPRLLCPVTRDRRALLAALEQVGPAEFGADGTAIGSALAAALNRLRGGSWERRAILLITDGVNNRGPLAPLDAARMAAALGVEIFAVGIGTDAVSRFWVPGPQGEKMRLEARIEIDDAALEALARETGGAYRRVRDSAELRRVLSELSLRTRAMAVREVRQEDERLPRALAAAALLCLLAEFVIAHLFYSELPG